MKDFFTAIPEAQAIIHSSGVYRQVPLYLRDNRVYAKIGSGFVRLSQGGATSAPKVRWAEGLYTPEGAFKEGGSFVEYLPPAGEVIAHRVAAE
jgi:hypothetical protein